MAGQHIDCCVWPAFCWVGRVSSGYTEERPTGSLFRLGGSNRQVEGPSYLFGTITIFPESGFEEFQIIIEAFLVAESWLLAPRLKEHIVCWRDGGVIQGSGKGWWGWVLFRPYGTGFYPVSCIYIYIYIYMCVWRKSRWPSLPISMVKCIFL